MRISDWSSDVCSSDLVACDAPWRFAGNEGRAFILADIILDAAAAMRLVRLYPVDLFLGDAVRVVAEAPRIRQGEHLAAKLDDLFRRAGRDIARAGDHRGLAAGSEERRVGEECVSRCISRCGGNH